MSTLVPQQISIVGAGLSGLTLALCLKHKGIPAVTYDRATSSPRYNYGITLHASTYHPLLPLLQLDESTFRSKLAVDASAGGVGTIAKLPDSFRCNRGRLESLLRDGLDIRWSKKLTKVYQTESLPSVSAVFEDGEQLDTGCLICCDGPHSIGRRELSSRMDFDILPYAVYNGKRHMPKEEYTQMIHPHLQGNVFHEARHGSTRLEISINDITQSHVDLNYVYSRPAKGDDDPLYRPGRGIPDAKDIPQELFDEIADLKDLSPLFKEVFDVDRIRQDKLLHWLMRVVIPDSSEYKNMSSSGVILIGDAIHATPILGGDGANAAIDDGLDLAEHIATHGVDAFDQFSDTKLTAWTKLVNESKKQIEQYHTSSMSHL